VYALVPGTDPHRRSGNPLRTSEDDGGLTGLAYAMLALVLVTGVPAGLVAFWFGWAGVSVGVATGALCYWLFGRLAAARLRTAGPDLLDTMRTGRRPERSFSTRYDRLSKPRKAFAAVCGGFGAIPLFPQGIVATVMVVNGKEDHSWFLATYMPPVWRYPVATAFIVIGVLMYGAALWIARPEKDS
jgi:ABC-2 type transport system permease protein